MSLQHITGRKRIPNFAGLTTNRDLQLRIEEAEPNLGFPTEKTLPLKSEYYQLVTYEGGDVGERYWQTAPGTAVTGISLFDEGFIVGTGSSITNLNFSGVAIAATATNFDSIGYITVTPPGNNTEILFKENDDFSTSSAFTFNKFTDSFRVGVGGSVITALGDGRVGIRSASPERQLDIIGDLKLTGRLYDTLNRPGDNTDIITRVNAGGTDGIEWISRTSFLSGAAGTTGSIQFQGDTGLLDGVVDFIYDKSNEFVGIGTTIPRARLDILSPKGTVLIGPLLRSTTSSKDNGLQFINAVGSYSNIDSAVYTEGRGRFINLGINASQVGIRTNSRVGGILRIDTRLPSDPDVSPFPLFGNTNSFVIKAVSIGDGDSSEEYNALVTNLETGNTYLSPEKGAVAIGTETISKRLNVFGYGLSNGIRIGDMQLSTFEPPSPIPSNNNFRGSPTFRNLNIDAKTNLRVIPNGNQTGQLEVFAKDYFADPTAWDNFRIFPTSTYIRLDTSSASSGTPKSISIETNVSENGAARANPNQLYLDITGNVGINTGSTTYALEVAGDIRLWEALRDNSGDGGGRDFVLQSTGGTSPRIKWTSLLSLTVGTAQQANTIRTVGVTTDKSFYLTFVDDPNTTSAQYEGLYTFEDFTINPGDSDLGSKLTFVGKSIIGNRAKISTINNIADPTRNLGLNAFRPLNIVDEDATIKIARLTDNTARDAAVDLQVWNSAGDTNVAAWDIYGGWFGFGSRNLSAGQSRTGFFISTEGNFLIGSEETLAEINAGTIIRNGRSNILQVIGNSYIDGKVGIGTSSQEYSLEVIGDALISGGIGDNNGSFGGNAQIITSQANPSSPSGRGFIWKNLTDTTVGRATSLANARNFSISGDGTSPDVSFDGTDDVDLVLTLSDVDSLVPGDYGSNSETLEVSVDSKGRVTAIQAVTIDFGTATVENANKIKTESSTGVGTHYFTFVDSDNPSGDFESVFTDNVLQYYPNINTIKLENNLATDTNSAAIWINSSSGSLLFDDGANKRISYNEGLEDFAIRAGSYYDGGNEKYITGTSDGNSGASKISFNQDGDNSEIDIKAAKTGSPGSNVTYTTGIKISSATTSITPIVNNTIDFGTNSNKWKSITATEFVGTFIGVADDSEQISIGDTFVDGKEYFLSFTGDDNTSPDFASLFTDSDLKVVQGTDTSSNEVIDLKATGSIISGSGKGGVGLAYDDSVSDAAIVFNHTRGIPDVSNNSARISFNSKSTSAPEIKFDLNKGGSVTSGSPETLDTILIIDETGILPGISSTYHLGSSSHQWDQIYATTFNGKFVGVADVAQALWIEQTPSTTGDVFLTFQQAPQNSVGAANSERLFTTDNLKFNVTQNLFTTGNINSSNINAGITTASSLKSTNDTTVGRDLEVTRNLTVDGNSILGTSGGTDTVSFNGLLATNIIPNTGIIDLGSDANPFRKVYSQEIIGISSLTDRITTRKREEGGALFLTFTDKNSTTAVASSIFTNDGLNYTPTTDRLGCPNILATTQLLCNGNSRFGNNINEDLTTFQSKIDSSIIPNGADKDLGSAAAPWRNIYADSIVGTANTVKTVEKAADTTDQYITFVDENNPVAGGPQPEQLFTNAALAYNINNSLLKIQNLDLSSNKLSRARLQNYSEYSVIPAGTIGANYNIDLDNGNFFVLRLGATTTTFSISGGITGSDSALAFTVLLRNNAAGQVVSFPDVTFPSGTIPTKTDTAGRADVWVFISPDGGTNWYGNITIFDLA